MINQDITLVSKGIICHQVNCRGKMGAGLALSLRKKYPIVYNKYVEAHNIGYWELGKTQFVSINNSLQVANMAGQDNYSSRQQMTDYKALQSCLNNVKEMHLKTKLPIYLPYKLGCGLAGGDWNKVLDMIFTAFAGLEFYICKHN